MAPQPPAPSRNTLERILSALVLAPLVIGAIWAGGWVFGLFNAITAAITYGEWWRLGGRWPTSSRIRFRLAGVIYVGLFLISVIWLRNSEGGLSLILLLFLAVWGSDIGGYVVGRALGGPKLWPRLSPNKTWAGALGGVGFAILAGAAVVLVSGHASLMVGVAAAALIAVTSQAGDLLESWLKRVAGVKDSGAIIPGHGGLLDRIDGLIAAAPLLALLHLATGGHWW